METDSTALLKKTDLILEFEKSEYEKLYAYVEAIFTDVVKFPVGTIENMPSASYSYVDSWQFARTYGGERAHEGCDIMASYNKRGIYPIYSATDGVIEKIGWLKLGGYRIGIRSSSGAYYYYAHLDSYERAFEKGDSVAAGEVLGRMGDSGYGKEPGTKGHFDVHLHVGIYVKDLQGSERALNPYWYLKRLEI